MRNISIIGFISFLLVFTAVFPVFAYDWGSPLATDTAIESDIDPPEDILSVDAIYIDGFVFFRFVMNSYIVINIDYIVHCDFDKNYLTGSTTPPHDIGSDFSLFAVFSDYLNPGGLTLLITIAYNATIFYVYYNMTANNGTAMEWSSPTHIQNLPWISWMNNTQGEVVFGVNWTWVTELMVIEGVLWDGISMYLEFEAGWDSDWCPDRTAGSTDFIEWIINAEKDGIPGFSLGFAVVGLLVLLGIPVLLQKKQKKFARDSTSEPKENRNIKLLKL